MANNDIDWLRDEEIVYETGIHKIVFLQIIFFAIFLFLTITAIFFTLYVNSGVDQFSLIALVGVELFLIVVLLLISVPQFMLWKKSYLTVTNQRIIYRIGWIHQNVGEILLSRLIGINVEQDFMARIFNYGTIKFNGDNDALQPLTLIASPFELKRQVMNQIHTNA